MKDVRLFLPPEKKETKNAKIPNLFLPCIGALIVVGLQFGSNAGGSPGNSYFLHVDTKGGLSVKTGASVLYTLQASSYNTPSCLLLQRFFSIFLFLLHFSLPRLVAAVATGAAVANAHATNTTTSNAQPDPQSDTNSHDTEADSHDTEAHAKCHPCRSHNCSHSKPDTSFNAPSHAQTSYSKPNASSNAQTADSKRRIQFNPQTSQ